MQRLIKQTIETTLQSQSRRQFLKVIGGLGAGLTIALHTPLSFADTNNLNSSDNPAFEANAFVRINPDNTVSVFIKHIEMGQGTFTGLATLVAEELDASWSQIRSEAAATDGKRYNNLFWGPMQGTGGSTAIANSYQQMRMAGATAKAMLVSAAAQLWQVPETEISVNEGMVSAKNSNKQAQFGELAALAASLPMPDEDQIKLKKPAEFKLIGKQNLSRKDTGKTDGTAIFTQDIKLDGMLTAMVLHPPKFGSTITSIDDTQAKSSEGVIKIVQIPTGVAVIATDYWSAQNARDKLKVVWDHSKAFTKSSTQIIAEYKEIAAKPGLIAREEGNLTTALTQAKTVLEATYEFPYLAHAAMEPMNCVAVVNKNSCEIWNGEQFQTVDQMNIAKALNMSPEQIKINMLFAGGSFGRRANPHSDYLVETVEIARQMQGTPIKLVWSREDDMRAAYFRPAYAHKLTGALDENGNISVWQQHIVGQSIASGTVFESGMIKNGVDVTSVEGASNIPYAIDNIKIESTTVKQAIPIQWWRSVGSTHTAYAVETFIDELAVKAGKDPYQLRRQLLAKHPRLKGVLELAANKAHWGAKLPKNWGRGIAVHESFNSYVAQVVDVSVSDNGQFKVEKVVCAVDCGVAVNPDIIRAQMEGGIGFGLSPVLMSAITIKDGEVVESNFHNYQVLRINQMPEIEVHIMPSAEPPTGVGEPGVPPIAPAVANALANVTGKRYYQLPLKV
ncbi:xanthine dehydrogenase family protein molybdopterin-binding subunit [Catenovulum sp. 2E275]|uniref:xanthine dehydrogenase family protein molybdopterin-binding subunit n=1 Tax=Catenovulum sp. 2E275 TaxID=2980497 RepID=UPI0021CF24DA|nr:xanthine dehydrogenase family protein molybdopterin-binding subunit [Catenovulum sp. 2E275]MCU4674079.1 xanthine dehydrogenase family protein molybdopterin-binding subunit [Catenovulum sp. 2E275]